MADAPNIFGKQYILTAGPTPLPPAVSQVMAEPILYHRAPAFVEIYARVLERLSRVFQTRNQVLCFAATGTGAMESAVANLVAPGEPAVVASCGKFGQRWAELCDAYGADTLHLEFEWGEKVDPGRLDEALAGLGRPARAVFTTQSETSTGVVNDIRALNEAVKAHDSVLAVDAVSGLGAVDLPQDEWGVDVVVAGSQKSLMCPPGLAFASVSDHAMAPAAELPTPRYYLDGAQVPKLMRDRYGVTIAGGQGHLKGRIARIAHCGYYGAFDIVVALTALEMALRDLGHDAEPGAGAGAAQRVFSEAGSTPTPVG